MEGTFKEHDELLEICGPYVDGVGGFHARVGENGVSLILVCKAAGPMGFYAVAKVFKDDGPASYHPIHMLETVVHCDA